jgi:hypothetical protein
MCLLRGKTRDDCRQPSSNDELGYRRPLKPFRIHFDLREVGFLTKQKARYAPGLFKADRRENATRNCT